MKQYRIKIHNYPWRPYVFTDVIASVTDAQGNRSTHAIEGECYSEYTSGPSLLELANYVASQVSSAAYVGLKSCTPQGLRI